MKPLISIIVPCYNQAQYLDECLQSVIAQTYENWECIIINDGSPDNTDEIANKWLKKDARFRYISKENGGLSSARNAGLRIAKGSFIQFLDSDDFLENNKFEESIECFNQKPDLDVVITNFSTISEYSKKIMPSHQLSAIQFTFQSVLKEWDFTFAIPIHCALFKIKSIGDIRFNEQLKAKEDWFFWIQFFYKNQKSKFIDRYLVCYRMHKDSMTKSSIQMKNSEEAVVSMLQSEISNSEFIDFLQYRMNIYKQWKSKSDLKYKLIKNSLTYRFASRLKRILKICGLKSAFKSVLLRLTK